MTVHLVNPSHLSFGIGVITPRWLFVLAGGTPARSALPPITHAGPSGKIGLVFGAPALVEQLAGFL